nr:MAG TPA: hypothetical protein [Caudoviricetes sp.]
MVILTLMRTMICSIRISTRVTDRHLCQRRNYTTILISITRLLNRKPLKLFMIRHIKQLKSLTNCRQIETM